MGRYFALTLGLASQAVKSKPKTKSFAAAPNFGHWVFILLVLFSIAYLVQVNGSSTKGYEISRLEQRLAELREANKRLELETASLKSIQHIEENVQHLNLVPSGKVRYLGDSDFALGSKDL